MAHSNLIEHGKGIGKKADDCFVAILCYKCHNDYDTKRIDESTLGSPHYQKIGYIVSQEKFNRAMHKTWKLLLQNGVLK